MNNCESEFTHARTYQVWRRVATTAGRPTACSRILRHLKPVAIIARKF